MMDSIQRLLIITRSVMAMTVLMPGAASASQSAVDADAFPIVNSLLAGGARGLARRYIDSHQHGDLPIATWIRWERLRIRLYKERHDWPAITARVKTLPEETPLEFKQWLLTEAAQAELNAGHAKAARRHLRTLIWRTRASPKQLAHWRRIVIRSYLADANVSDAQIALLRYQTDYRAHSDVWQVLRARVLLRAHRYKEAFHILGEIQTVEGRVLHLYAALHSGIYKPDVVMTRCRRLVKTPRTSPGYQQQLWILAAQAAKKSENYARQAIYLERALAVSPKTDAHPQNDYFFPLTADDLWRAYENLAQETGNRERLLVGNDSAWMEKAEILAKPDPLASRAIYGFLATRASANTARQTAHQRFSDALFAADLAAVARTLYAQTRRYVHVKEIPDAVRYRLANEALKIQDIHQAARWMKGLKQAPEGEDVDQWMLRRARTLIYAGDVKPAVKLLRKLLDKHQVLKNDLANRTLQILFDLQAIREHARAYELMTEVYQRVHSETLRRELLYWMGESKAALGEHEKAAEFYLRSAAQGQAKGKDMWGQSARFRAAESLGRAGLVDDARNTYRRLLRVTGDAQHRALLNRKLQQLWLMEKKETAP